MKSKLLDEQGDKTYILIFDEGDEVISTLVDFARKNRLDSSHFTAIGAFSSVSLGYFEIDRKQYKKIPVNEQVETLSLIGDISLDKGEPKVHAHVVVGKSDGSTAGGHLLEAKVRPTLEVVLTETPKQLRRKLSPEFGIALIDLDQS